MALLPARRPGLSPPRRGSAGSGLVAAVLLSLGLHAVTMLPIRVRAHLEPSRIAAPVMLARLIRVEPDVAEVRAPTAPEDTVAAVAVRPTVSETAIQPTPALAAVPTRSSMRRAASDLSESVPATPPVPLAEPDIPGVASAAAMPTGLPPAPAYAKAGTLDPPPRPLHDVEPEYPKAAGLREGSVVLRLLINESGGVDNVGIVRSFPPGLFEESAVAAFGAARFSPGMLFGLPVKSQVTIEVMFTPFNRGSAVSGKTY